MQNLRKFALPIAVFLFLFVFILLIQILPSSEESEPAKFEIPDYSAEFTIGKDRKIEVTENVTVRFKVSQHGIIRDFPLDFGVRYGNITATRDGERVPTNYRFDTASMLSLAVGDEHVSLSSGKDYLYTFTYTMTVPAQGEEGYLSLDVLGFDWQAKVGSVAITVNFPDGFLDKEIYSGAAGTEENARGVVAVQTGNSLVLTAEELGFGGITLDMKFEEGVLGTTVDLTPLWALLIVLAVGGAFVLFKRLKCREPLITRTVNLTAPDEMDPLLMGKLLDDKVDSEDLGALVFWFASQGYLKIDLSENDEDPTLIKTEKSLPVNAPAHVRTYYDGLFAGRDRVRVSQLTNSFYRTAETVKASVNVAAGQVYTKQGTIGAILFGVLTVLLFGGFTLLWNYFTLGGGYLYYMQLVICAAAFAISACFSYTAQRLRYKWSKWKCALLLVASFLFGCLPALFVLGFPSAALTLWARLVFAVASAAFGTLSGFLFTYTEKHAEKLGHILGFKDFILYTEKDKIEFMLKEDPELYYNILPYAQVLGVTAAWTEKFKGLDMPAPSYAYYNRGYTFNALLWHSTFHSMNRGMSRNMVSRPTNSGGGYHGGGGGHFGGGHGGGGHGGGGGRSF